MMGVTAAPAPADAPSGAGPRKPIQPHASKLKPKGPSRRSMALGLGGFMWLVFTGAMGFFVTLIVRFLFPNVLYEKPTTFKIGYPQDFIPNGVDERFLSGRQIWVNRDDTKIYVLKAVCTHLGCTPAWQSGDRKFKCPCHGSGFRFNGMNFEGPAPRPLERYKVFLADDGQIVVDTTKVFLQETQWTDPEANIPA
jgi:cytochrome b6-f complex iron-sulfur subunit